MNSFLEWRNFYFDFYFIVDFSLAFLVAACAGMPEILNAQALERLLFYIMERSPRELFDRIPEM